MKKVKYTLEIEETVNDHETDQGAADFAASILKFHLPVPPRIKIVLPDSERAFRNRRYAERLAVNGSRK